MSFIERSTPLLVIQITTFGSNLKSVATVLGFSTEQVKQAEDDAAYMGWVEKCRNINEAYLSSYISFQHLLRYGAKDVTTIAEPVKPVFVAAPTIVPAGVQRRFSLNAKQAKANPACTLDIQKFLGIAPVVNPVAKEDEVPDLKVKESAGYPTVSFHKYDHDGISLYRDKGDGKGYSTLPFKTILYSPFTDKDLPAVGQVAVYKYKAIYLTHDEESGKFSPETSINVVGR